MLLFSIYGRGGDGIEQRLREYVAPLIWTVTTLPATRDFSGSFFLTGGTMQFDKTYSFQEKRELLNIGKQAECDYLYIAKFLLRDMPEEEFQRRLDMIITIIKSEPMIKRDCGLLLDYLIIKAKPLRPIKTQRAHYAIISILKQVYS